MSRMTWLLPFVLAAPTFTIEDGAIVTRGATSHCYDRNIRIKPLD